MTSSTQFWDATFESNDLRVIDCQPYSDAKNRTEEKLYDLLSDVEGLDVLEVGCGTGELAVYMSKRGANVTATDLSGNAIERTRELAEVNQVKETMALHQVDALNLGKLGKKFDLIVGKFILHHVEPFDEFVDVIYGLLKEDGRVVFMENSSRNPVLKFARNNLVGRFGIPKHGDFDEYPLEPAEVELMARRFEKSKQKYPEFVFFGLLNTYLFRGWELLSPVMAMTEWIDRTVYKLAPAVRKYSYYQIIEATKQP